MPETESLEPCNTNNIILIGMPACGKSTLGVLLAKALNYRFLDSDLVIQEQTGKLLKELIQEHGIEGFNQIENDVNAMINVDHTIVATGGSAVYGADAMKHFKEIGSVVYLKVSYKEVSRRLGDLDERGVVHRPDQTLRDLYNERTALYEKYADITIEEPDGNPNIANLLADAISVLRDCGF
ncbi:MAG: shikimate kinase [Lachnospiraceae bacterium]|nr:shikimate kinase [Lachnospiraceae bacterium]